ncbi:hypothetical protein ACET3Z_018212 [Daucus carota]
MNHDEAAVVDNTNANSNSKNKKKKRRSNRKSKHSSASAPVNGICLESPCPLSPGTLDEHNLLKASDVAFTSLPTMHLDEQQEGGILQNNQMLPSDYDGRMLPRSCPEPIACKKSTLYTNVRYDSRSSPLSQCKAQRRIYCTYWSNEAVTQGLESGDVFKALIRVNAHNRLEAYCKIGGVPTDILINGILAQNRAIEGDIVLIKIDPLSSWTKMKGSSGPSNSAAVSHVCGLVPEPTVLVGNISEGEGIVDIYFEFGNRMNLLEKKLNDEGNTYFGENGSPGPVGTLCKSCVSKNLYIGSSREPKNNASAVRKLCAMTSAYPLKRPTGKVVAIIESSSYRDGVVGILDVKQWIFSREDCTENCKPVNLPLSLYSVEYIPFVPTDSKFPKMMVPVSGLPDCIQKRLEVGDATIEAELVAARVVDWGEEDDVPEAHVIRVFGFGADVEAHIAAILFENAIHSCEFPPEILSCLPSVNWVVPQKEYQNRRDIRDLCVFTIDPASATDLDDALSVEWLSSGIFRVGVHIADASYFVLPGSALDVEAQFRSTSVYLLRRKFPMLPSLLSENLGSLNPGVERLAFSIFWGINFSGEVLDRWIGRTIIQSCCKLSYEQAQDIIDGKFDVENFTASENGLPHVHGKFQWSHVVKSVKSLHAVSKTLQGKRYTDGALSLNNPKLNFLFDEDGSPYDCVISRIKDSQLFVEEFLLLANRTAAEVITRAYPSTALLRRHPEPNLHKLKEFESFCSKHGLNVDTSSSGKLHLSLTHIKQELKDDFVLFDILLSYATRSMQIATYFCSGNLEDCEADWGHYSLAVPLYTHFTSPLRRYPDIVVHRTLAAAAEAEAIYTKNKLLKHEDRTGRFLTGIYFNKDAIESHEGQEALSIAAAGHSVPCTEMLTVVAAHSNERKLASRHVKDATDKLYMWLLLRKEVFFSKARVVGLGPRFMSIYIQKLAIERRIYYDEVEGLTAEWLDATCTLILNPSTNKGIQRKGTPAKCRPLEEAVLIVSPHNLMAASDPSSKHCNEAGSSKMEERDALASIMHPEDIEPSVFPLIVRNLSTISVVLHAVGGNGPLDIGARLYASSYLV